SRAPRGFPTPTARRPQAAGAPARIKTSTTGDAAHPRAGIGVGRMPTGEKAGSTAPDTRITLPLPLLARTRPRIEQDTAVAAVHVFIFGRHARGKLAMSDLSGERPMASLYY